LRIGEEIGFVISQTSTMRTDMRVWLSSYVVIAGTCSQGRQRERHTTTVIPAQAGIQYTAAYRFNHYGLWNTGSPPSRG
jgi:hypothetical protein